VQSGVVDQRLSQLADRLLAAGAQTVLLLLVQRHAHRLGPFIDSSLTSPSDSAETLPMQA
jgi:hypothetical protein